MEAPADSDLADIAPEDDRDAVNGSLHLTEQFDLDSLDYLTLLIGISEETGLDILQGDVSRFLTIDGSVSYLIEMVSV